MSPAVRTGLSAYANKQGSIFHNLAVRFSQRWRSVLISLSLPDAWASEFLEAHKEPLDNPDFKKRKQTGQTGGPPVAHAHAASPPPVATSASIPPAPIAPETINHEAQSSSVDYDGSSSEYDDDSGASSWAD